MESGRRYAVMAIMAIITIIILVVLFNIVRSVFDGGDDDSAEQQSQTVNLKDAARAGEPARYTIQGDVVGDERRRSIRITIDEKTRRLEILQGYNNQVIRTEEFYNTQDAYNAFASALTGGGYVLSVDSEGRGNEDEVCPLGRHFIYEVAPGASSAHRTWSTSCSQAQGTFGGNAELIRQLFQLQIPNYNELTSNVQLVR